MSAIAVELPAEVREARDGLIAFARAEVLPRHEKHRALLEDSRRLYRADGRFSDEAVALIGAVRRAAAKAGFYAMCVPTALGARGRRMAHLGAQNLDDQCADRRLLHRVRRDRSQDGIGAQRRYLRLSCADRVAGV